MTDIPEGWIAHDGGSCPVPLDSYPAVRFRDGGTVTGFVARRGRWSIFPGHESFDDIIAYKPETQP